MHLTLLFAVCAAALVLSSGVAAEVPAVSRGLHDSSSANSCNFPDAVVGDFSDLNTPNNEWLACFSMTSGHAVPLINLTTSQQQTDMVTTYVSTGDAILWLSFTATVATVNVYTFSTGEVTALAPLTPGPHQIGVGWYGVTNGAVYDAATGGLYVILSLSRQHGSTQHLYLWPSVTDVTAQPSLVFDFTPSSGFGYDANIAWTLDSTRNILYAIPTYATEHHSTGGDPCESSSFEPRTSSEGCEAFVVAIDLASQATTSVLLPGLTFAYALVLDPVLPDILHCWADTGVVTINVTQAAVTSTVHMQQPKMAGWQFYGLGRTQIILTSTAQLGVANYELSKQNPFTVINLMVVQDLNTGAILSSVQSTSSNTLLDFIAVPAA